MATKKHIAHAARDLFRFCRPGTELDETRARHVVQELASSGRRDAIPLLTAFLRLVRLDRDRHAALVESAEPLGGGLRSLIEADLARIYGPRITTSFRQNPALIGGVRIKVGSDVYDGSVRARLAALEARL
jgi:F-type H+-transporting ATPase subunit delta